MTQQHVVIGDLKIKAYLDDDQKRERINESELNNLQSAAAAPAVRMSLAHLASRIPSRCCFIAEPAFLSTINKLINK